MYTLIIFPNKAGGLPLDESQNDEKGGLKPKTEAQRNWQCHKVIRRSGALVVKILTIEGQTDPEPAAEEIGDPHFESCGRSSF